MKNLNRFVWQNTYAILVCLLMPSALLIGSAAFPTLTSLIEAFEPLAANRDAAAYHNSGFALRLPTQQAQLKEFMSQIDQWMRMRAKIMNNDGLWAPSNNGVVKPAEHFFDVSQPVTEFMPYAQRCDGLGYKIIMRGDLHGDIRSLIAQLKDMKDKKLIGDDFVLKKEIVMAFLGDYVDRGNYGVEVLYTLALLGNANPENVWYVRGNHEDIFMSSQYGFAQEVVSKFGDVDGSIHKRISRMYDLMPVVIYVGDSMGRYVQLCHGGIEQGYSPKGLFASGKQYQLLGVLNRAQAIHEIQEDVLVSDNVKKDMGRILRIMQDNIVLKSPIGDMDSDLLPLGFMWNDFDPTGSGAAVWFKSQRGLEYGQDGVNVVLRHQEGNFKIMAIFRAHQHTADKNDPMMKNIMKGHGIACMRRDATDSKIGDTDNKDVYTLNVSPDSVYGKEVGFDYDTSIVLIPTESGPWTYSKQHYYPLKNNKHLVWPMPSTRTPRQMPLWMSRYISYVKSWLAYLK